MNSYYRFLKGFYGPADIPTIFQEKIDRTLGHQTPVWLDIIIVDRKNTLEKNIRYSSNYKMKDTEQAKKIKILPKRKNMARAHNITRWLQTKLGKNRRNQQILTSTNTKTLKSILAALQ